MAQRLSQQRKEFEAQIESLQSKMASAEEVKKQV
jgi:hypothetical protein